MKRSKREQKQYRSNKPGLRPSVKFFERLSREHPKLRVAWCREADEWVVIQRGIVNRRWQLLMGLGRCPSEHGTFRRLADARLGRMTPEKASKFLLRLDAAQAAVAKSVERASEERFTEAADRIYSASGAEARVSMHGTRQ